MFLAIPSRSWNSSKRVTPKKASLMISRVHHSPITSSACAIEQFMSSNDARRMGHTLQGCIMQLKRRNVSCMTQRSQRTPATWMVSLCVAMAPA